MDSRTRGDTKTVMSRCLLPVRSVICTMRVLQPIWSTR